MVNLIYAQGGRRPSPAANMNKLLKIDNMMYRAKNHVQELEKRNSKERGKYIKSFLKESGIHFQVQKFKPLLSRKGENIIVDYPFRDQPAEKKVLLTAHYDVYFGAPGANDDASGVAVLFALLARMKRENPHTPLPLRVVFFDLEETVPVGYGSRAYIKEYGIENIETLYNLDMVGMGETLLILPVAGDAARPKSIERIHNAALQNGFDVEYRLSIGLPKGFDHMPFIEKGLKDAYTLFVIPNQDRKFKPLYSWINFRLYRLTRGRLGNIAEVFKYHHSRDDISKYISDKTLERVINTVWDGVIKGKQQKQINHTEE